MAEGNCECCKEPVGPARKWRRFSEHIQCLECIKAQRAKEIAKLPDDTSIRHYTHPAEPDYYRIQLIREGWENGYGKMFWERYR